MIFLVFQDQNIEIAKYFDVGINKDENWRVLLKDTDTKELGKCNIFLSNLKENEGAVDHELDPPNN